MSGTVQKRTMKRKPVIPETKGPERETALVSGYGYPVDVINEQLAREQAKVKAMTVDQKQKRFVAWLSQYLSVKDVCERMGITQSQVYYWEDANPMFGAAVDKHRSVIMRRLANDSINDVIMGKRRLGNVSESGLMIYRANGGKAGTGQPATIRVVFEDGKMRAGVEIQLPGAVDGNDQQ